LAVAEALKVRLSMKVDPNDRPTEHVNVAPGAAWEGQPLRLML
jgi:hypothetical protein